MFKGEVSPEIDITETTKELQNKVKEHVEKCTGVNVNEVKVVISNVTGSIRNVNNYRGVAIGKGNI